MRNTSKLDKLCSKNKKKSTAFMKKKTRKRHKKITYKIKIVYKTAHAHSDE